MPTVYEFLQKWGTSELFCICYGDNKTRRFLFSEAIKYPEEYRDIEPLLEYAVKSVDFGTNTIYLAK